jgi:hypothetical protein
MRMSCTVAAVLTLRNSAKAGSAEVLVRTASEARAVFSRFALIADRNVRAPSSELGEIEPPENQ